MKIRQFFIFYSYDRKRYLTEAFLINFIIFFVQFSQSFITIIGKIIKNLIDIKYFFLIFSRYIL